MRKSLIVLVLAITGLYSCGPRSNFKAAKVAKNSDRQQSLIHDIEKASGYRYIYTDTTYAFSTGKGITIQNSVPKGGNIEPGGPYIDAKGRQYFYAAFWTRIINGTDIDLEFEVNFPADSFPLSSSSDSFLKLFIPTDTMTFDKLPLFNYGLTGMKSFVDSNWKNATTLQKTIKPNEEQIFYTVALAYQAGGPARSAIILKGKKLFYRTTMGPHGPFEIPFGKTTFINEDGN